MSVYRVTHRTEYRYDEPVTASYGQTHLLPRSAPGQDPQDAAVSFWPVPDDRRTRTDFHGNRCVAFSILAPHTRLTIEAASTVEVTGPPGPTLAADMPWEVARDAIRRATDTTGLEAREMALASPRVALSAVVHAYATPSFPPGRPLLDAVVDLSHRIHTDFGYDPSATDVGTTVDEALKKRKGVCQDFAHLAIACVRAQGLAARYVSGYLETVPPPGQERLEGADATHAWLAVHLPGDGWVGVDPTNDVLAGERHVTTAWGRDYGDVPPVEGIIFTDGTTHEMEVAVDVVRLPTPGAGAPA
jgi:transglutaminase-like putative cysteine protease